MAKRILSKLAWYHWFLLFSALFFLGTVSLLLIIAVATKHNAQKTPIDPLVARYSPPQVESPRNVKHFVYSQGQITSGEKVIRVPILMYHYIENNKDPKDTIRRGLTVTPYYFERQLQILKENGYTTITLNDLAKALTGEEILPAKPIILTFDDGYRDFYTDAFPLLQKYNVKATNYVIANHIGRSGNLTADMIKELIASGLVTIGAHTLNHPDLVSLSRERAWEEIVGSKEKLEKEFGIKVLDFAYPYGFFNNQVANLVKQAGYESATATTFGATHSKNVLYYLSRIRVGNYDGQIFLDRIEKQAK